MADETRDRILDAAERLLARLGYQKTTMDDLATEAGVSKRTIYLHFRSKEETTLSTIDRIVERLLTVLEDLAGSSRPVCVRLQMMLTTRVLFRFDSVRDYHQGIDELFRAIRPAYLARRSQYFEAEAAVFGRVLEEGKKDGSFSIGVPEEVAQSLILATNALLPSGLSPQELGARSSVEKQADRIAALLIEGVRQRERSKET